MEVLFVACFCNLLHIANFNSISIPRTQSRVSVSLPWEEQIPPNAVIRKRNPSWRGGFSLGVDMGLSLTGLALSKGFSIRPLTVLELRGQKLELRLLDIAESQGMESIPSGWAWNINRGVSVNLLVRGTLIPMLLCLIL